jgi:hypothetical protein
VASELRSGCTWGVSGLAGCILPRGRGGAEKDAEFLATDGARGGMGWETCGWRAANAEGKSPSFARMTSRRLIPLSATKMQ